MTNCPVSFIPRWQHSVSCKGSPLQNPVHGPVVVTRVSVPQANFKEVHALVLILALLSKLSTDSVYIRLATRRMKEVVSAVHCSQVPTLQWIPAVLPRGRS